uniref:HU domain-containing protein n=1 Tax=uncultured Draconibacterium sp. TaxID=1573823 RepID=UPI0032179A5A
MNFGKFIHELLLENEIVIIPGFGAFVSKYKPAEISEDSDEIKPPSKEITFNQLIKNNDGLLVGHVAEIKQISHFDALKMVEKERDEIIYKLDSGEEVELSDIGTLFYTEENTIGFKPFEDENMLLDSFGLQATSISAIEEETPVKETEKQKEETAEEPVPELKDQVEFIKSELYVEKKKRGWLWMLLILIPLIAVSVFIYMQGLNKNTTTIPEEPVQPLTKIEKPVIVPQDTIKKDTVIVAENDTVTLQPEQQEMVVESDTTAQKYYLVGGSFSVEENAETFIAELKAKGLNPFHVGKKGRFFIVALDKYNTFNEAEQAKQNYMNENPDSEVWVWKK